MPRPSFAALSLAIALAGIPRGAEAQRTRSSHFETSGSTRHYGSSSRRSSGSRSHRSHDRDDDDDDDYGYRRSRRRRRRWHPRLLASDCVYVDDGWCYYDAPGADLGGLSVGFSLDYLGGIFPTDPNGLASERVDGHVDVGLLATTGGGGRVWLLYDRLRIALMGQGGGAWRASRAQPPTSPTIEAGSRVGDGTWFSVYLAGGYQPQLSDVVSLYLGGRLGVHALFMPLEWDGRPYDSLHRVFFSGGPEVGVLLSDGAVGLMVWAFADLGQPGMSQLSIALLVEDQPHDGSAF